MTPPLRHLSCVSQKLKHPLYAIHWVWGGSTLESKRQNMRDAMKFHDEPDYYTSPNLVTFDLDLLPVRACCVQPVTYDLCPPSNTMCHSGFNAACSCQWDSLVALRHTARVLASLSMHADARRL